MSKAQREIPRPGKRSEAAPDVTVVIPVYRSAETVRPLSERLRRVFQGEDLRYEIVFVNDACPDGSLEVLRRLAALDPQIAVIALPKNVGQHRAVLAGMARARGNAIAVMDADLQDPPEALPALLREMRQGFAAVFAGRRGRYESHARLLTSRLFKRLLSRLTGVPSDAGMFFVMTGEMSAFLLAQGGEHPFLPALVGTSGLPVSSIPVLRVPRPHGRSSYTAWMRLSTGCRALGSAVLRK